jgi:hypothetical protein
MRKQRIVQLTNILVRGYSRCRQGVTIILCDCTGPPCMGTKLDAAEGSTVCAMGVGW